MPKTVSDRVFWGGFRPVTVCPEGPLSGGEVRSSGRREPAPRDPVGRSVAPCLLVRVH